MNDHYKYRSFFPKSFALSSQILKLTLHSMSIMISEIEIKINSHFNMGM